MVRRRPAAGRGRRSRNETASGWQQQSLPTPVPITTDTTYVVVVLRERRALRVQPRLLRASGVEPRAAARAGRRRVARQRRLQLRRERLPRRDVLERDQLLGRRAASSAPARRTPARPRSRRSAPPPSATGVPRVDQGHGHLRRAVDRVTVNTGSITLKDGRGAAVAGLGLLRRPDRARPRSTPLSPLRLGKEYTVTVMSGTAGVTDLRGQPAHRGQGLDFPHAGGVPVHRLQPGHRRARGATAVHDQPVELGVQFTRRRGRLHHLAALLQAGEQRRHARRATCGPAPATLLAAATVHQRDGVGLAERRACRTRCAITKNTTYIASYHSAGGIYAFDQGFFTHAVDNAADDGARRRRRRRQRRLPLRRRAHSRTRPFNAHQLLGRRDRSTGRCRPTRAARRSPTPPGRKRQRHRPQDPASPRRSTSRSQPASRHRVDVHAEGADGGAGPGHRHLRRPDAHGDAAPARPARVPDRPTAPRSRAGPAASRTPPATRSAADKTWSFTTTAQPPPTGPGGPILVVTGRPTRSRRYYAEILRGEGLNEFARHRRRRSPPPLLAGKTSSSSARCTLTDARGDDASNWVQRRRQPDRDAPGQEARRRCSASRDAAGTLPNGYMKVDPELGAGAGIDGRRSSSTARPTATRSTAPARSRRSTPTRRPPPPTRPSRCATSAPAAARPRRSPTTSPARSSTRARATPPGPGRSATAMRAAASAPTTCSSAPRPATSSPTGSTRTASTCPQADEQQRLLANLITEMNLDKAPLPRFWYLPRGEKAAIVLTGDDHATGGTAGLLRPAKSPDPPGCSVADWECPRATSYMFTDTPLTDLQASGTNATASSSRCTLSTGCATGRRNRSRTTTCASSARSPPPGRASSRRSQPHALHRLERLGHPAKGGAPPRHPLRHELLLRRPVGLGAQAGAHDRVRLPAALRRHGRLADRRLPVDDAGHRRDERDAPDDDADPRADRQGPWPEQYWGVFTVLLHSDYGDHRRLNDLVSDAQQRHVPVISSAQMLDWTDGRNGSSFGNISYCERHARLLAHHELQGARPPGDAAGALGLRAALAYHARGPAGVVEPAHGQGRRLRRLRRSAGRLQRRLRNDTTPPSVSQVNATTDGEGHATISWNTDEPSTSLVEYGRTTALGKEKLASAEVTDHKVELSGLAAGCDVLASASRRRTAPGTRPRRRPPEQARQASTRRPGRSSTRARTSSPPARSSEHARRRRRSTGSTASCSWRPTIGEEFDSGSLPAGWSSSPFGPGGKVTVADGGVSADGALTDTTDFYDPPRVLEFTGDVPDGERPGDRPRQRPHRRIRMAVVHDRQRRRPVQLYAASGAWSGETQHHPAAWTSPRGAAPLPDRVEGPVRGLLRRRRAGRAPRQTDTIDSRSAPVISDFGLFGAAVRVDWLRMGTYAATGTMTSRVLDSGPGANTGQTLTPQQTLPDRQRDHLRDALRRHVEARRELVRPGSRWAPGARSPARRPASSSTARPSHDQLGLRHADPAARRDHLRRGHRRAPQHGTVAVRPPPRRRTRPSRPRRAASATRTATR